MPDEAPNAITSQTIGKVTRVCGGGGLGVLHRTIGLLLSCKWSYGTQNEKGRPLTNLPVETYQLAEDLEALAQLKDDAITIYHRGANAETTET